MSLLGAGSVWLPDNGIGCRFGFLHRLESMKSIITATISSFLLLVVPGATSSILAPSSDSLCYILVSSLLLIFIVALQK